MTIKSLLFLTLATACLSSATLAQTPARKKAPPKAPAPFTPPAIHPDAFYLDPLRDTCFGYTTRLASDTGGWIFKRYLVSFSYSNARIATSEWASTDSAANPESGQERGIISPVAVVHYHFDEGRAEYKAPYITFTSDDEKSGRKRFRIHRKASGAASHLVDQGDNRRWNVADCPRAAVGIRITEPGD